MEKMLSVLVITVASFVTVPGKGLCDHLVWLFSTHLGGSTGSSLQVLLEAETCIGINGDILPAFRDYCPSVLCIRALTATKAEL